MSDSSLFYTMGQEQGQVDFTQAMNELANRLRVLESKHGTYAEKLLVMNQNMIEEHKKTISEIKSVRQDLVNINKDIETVKNVVKHLSDEAGKFAKNQDVKVLQKYIDYWNPMNFMTEKDVLKLVDKILGEKGVIHKRVEKMEKEIDDSLETKFGLNPEGEKDGE